jgi:hypothetical protein
MMGLVGPRPPLGVLGWLAAGHTFAWCGPTVSTMEPINAKSTQSFDETAVSPAEP